MTDNFNSLVVSGAGAGGVGIAGMADVLVLTNQTTSGVYLADVGATGLTRARLTGPNHQPRARRIRSDDHQRIWRKPDKLLDRAVGGSD